MMCHNQFVIGSFNSRSAHNKKEYFNTLLSKVDILCIQEHWLSDLQLSMLGDINDSFAYAGVSGFDNSAVLQGRPYGGCAILWRSDIASTVTVLNCDSKRLCAIRLDGNQWNLLIICVYLPHEDNQVNNNAFIDELSRVEV